MNERSTTPVYGATLPHRRRARRRNWKPLIWALPAIAAYATFVLYPLAQVVHYSFFHWDGVGRATRAGWSNYTAVFTNPEIRASLEHALVLIVFFTVLPVGLGLAAASLIRELRSKSFSSIAQTILFVPQVVPLVGAGIMWTWLYSSNGLINGSLRAIGLKFLARAWLGDFNTALPAVGLIGTWVALGFCTVLFLSGIGKIDRSLFEAARLDGAGRVREFLAVTFPRPAARDCRCSHYYGRGGVVEL